MKKSLTIGAVSMALAGMPIMGAFASTQTATIQDTLSATITSACEFTRYGTAGASGQTNVQLGPSWDGSTTSATADKASHTYSATLKPGADVELGTSHFSGYCNSTDGFTVTVATPDLSTGSGASANTIPFAATTPSTTSGEGWTLTRSDGNLFTNTGTDTKFMQSSTATDSTTPVSETATYNVYTKSATKSGAYTANVVYTFTYEDPNAS